MGSIWRLPLRGFSGSEQWIAWLCPNGFDGSVFMDWAVPPPGILTRLFFSKEAQHWVQRNTNRCESQSINIISKTILNIPSFFSANSGKIVRM